MTPSNSGLQQTPPSRSLGRPQLKPGTLADSGMSDDEKPSPEELERRRQWFDQYADQLKASVVRSPEPGRRFACPCCRYLTLDERGGFEICPVCFWEDDGQDDSDASVVRGGPNGALSLEQARANYAAFGASSDRHRQHVRLPRPDERGDAG
jgi:hypothetical protein